MHFLSGAFQIEFGLQSPYLTISEKESIIVTTFSGTRISIPAKNFIPFAGYAGVFGTFEISFDNNNRIQSLHKF